MKNLTTIQLQNLSFPDCMVLEMNIDMSKKIASIKTDSGYLAINGGVKLKNCEILIKDWTFILANLYRTKTDTWENINKNIEKLEDICEFEFSEKIIFRGFGTESGQWIEIVFHGGSLEVRCEE